MSHSGLYAELAKSCSESDIKSVKVAMDVEKNKSRKYGFASFRNQAAADKFKERGESATDITYHSYNPKEKTEMRRAFNTVIVKGFQQEPARVNDTDYLDNRKQYIENMFKAFGDLQSVFVTQTKNKNNEPDGKLLAFVTFANSETAEKATKEMHEKEVDANKLYVVEALKKQQLAKEVFKYKNSKKRCNLFVKGFPGNVNKDQLQNFFEKLAGPESVERIRIEMDKNNQDQAKYAFVCFKQPDQAQSVKQQINTD
jgi:RNA recognition motif-containing protein